MIFLQFLKLCFLFIGWLQRTTGDKQKQSYCLGCRKSYQAHRKDLQKHAASTAHMKNMEKFSLMQRKLPELGKMTSKNEDKIRDLK